MSQSVIITNKENERTSALSKKLAEIGYDVFTVSDGDELVKALSANPPDILITDAFLKNFDVFDFLSRFGKDLKASGTKIFVKTALQNKAFEQKVLGFGADACLLKPVDYRFITGEKVPVLKKKPPLFFRSKATI